MSTETTHLAGRLTNTLGPGSVNLPPWLWRHLLRLLAAGRPVTAADLAEATGRNVDEVRHALAGLSDTEYDEQGRIVGYGITLRPTPHHFDVDGQQLYTWCALDTLIFPAILDRPATVVSPCHTTGRPVRLTVEPGKISSVEPATAVVSIVTPDTCASIRTAFCNQVHFFASPTAARPWLDQHPDATVVPVADALALAGPLTQTLLTADADTAAASDRCAPDRPAHHATPATWPSTEQSR